jgi:hypothetical protein
MARIQPGGGGYRQALVLLHRAFDETCGARLLAGDLERFFQQHPRHSQHRAGVIRFFESSRAVFCADPVPPAAMSAACRLSVPGGQRETMTLSLTWPPFRLLPWPCCRW